MMPKENKYDCFVLLIDDKLKDTPQAYPETFLKKMFTKGKNEISLILVFLVLISFVSAHVGNDDYEHHMMGGMYSMMSGSYGMGMGFFGWLIGILIIMVLVLLIVWLVRQIQKK